MGRKSPILIFINQYFLIQECLLIPLWLNSISKLESRKGGSRSRHQVVRAVAWQWQNLPQMIKNFNIFQENLREGDFHENLSGDQ